MGKTFLEKLDKWHEEEKHEEIVNEILKLNQEEKNIEILGKLARAYNNLEQYDKALEILKSMEKSEKDTALWNYRIGYTYFYMDGKEKEAEKHFKKALKINPDEEDVPYFLMQIYQNYSIDATENNKYDEAIEWANKAFKFAEELNDNDEIIWCCSRIGWCYDALTNYEEAVKYLSRALELGRNDIWINSEMAYSLSRNGNFEEAIKYGLKAIELGRDDAWINYEVAWIYSALDNYDKALEYYKISKDKGKEGIEVDIEIGRALAELGNFKESVEIFENTLKNDELESYDKAMINSQIAYTYRREQNYKVALKYALISNEQGRDDAWLNVEIGLNYFGLEDYKNALKYLLKAHELDEKYSFAILQIADTYKKMNEYEKVLEYLLKAYEYIPDDIWLNSEIGWVYNELENFEEGYKYLLKAEDLGRKDDWLYSEMGQALGRMGRYEEAIVKLKTVLEMPDVSLNEKIFVNSEIGWIYDRIKKREEALKYLFTAKELGRDDVWLNSEIAWSLVEFSDRYEEAESYFKKAMEQGRNDAWIFNQLGYLYSCMGKNLEAVEHLKKADELLPYDSWTNYHLAINLRKVGNIQEALDILNKSYEFTEYQGWIDLQLAWCYALLDEKDKANEYLGNVDKFLSAELEQDETLKKDYDTIKKLLSSYSYLA